MGRGDIRTSSARSARRRVPTKHELSARKTAATLSEAGIEFETQVAEDQKTAVQDFVTDLMHLVEARGWEWSEIEARARQHFDVEMSLHSRGEPHDGAAW